MFIHFHKKGQSTLEYAIVIAVIVAGLIAMQVYIKRGVQGRLKEASNEIGGQFSPGHTTGTYTTNSNASSNETIVPVQNSSGIFVSQTTSNSNQSQDRTVNEQTPRFQEENW